MTEQTITGITVDLDTNTLHVQLDSPGERVNSGASSRSSGIIDIGVGGRLVGVEAGKRYIPVMEPEADSEHLIRSANVDVDIVTDAKSGEILELVIPRRGEGYEITWPSGNE